MVQTYSDNNYIYSVDMMFAYLHFNKVKSIKYKIDENILKNLDYSGWGDPIKNIKYSPKQVLNNPSKFPEDYDRIQNADLKYPIIITGDGNIIDGVHRLTKSVLLEKKYINAYVFDNKLMKEFIIAKHNDWNKVDNLKTYQFIILYVERFMMGWHNDTL